MPKTRPYPVLTDEQKALIDTHWQDDAGTLLKLVYPDQDYLTLRDVEWKAIRAYLATSGRDPEVSAGLHRAVNELTDEQREFIAASYRDASGALELARTLFKDPKLTTGATEVRLVSAYIRKIDPKYRKEDELVDDIDYQPPKNLLQLVGRLNRYGIGIRIDGKSLSLDALSAQEAKQLEALLRYMRRPAFKVEADCFTKRVDREVFEEFFMSMCWDKPDLTPEYVVQYIQLASITVRRNQADRTARKLTERFEESLEDPTKKLSKSEVDALKNTADKTAEMLKQMNALIKTLSGDRAKMVSERIAGAASMHPLVQAWKTKEGRERQLALAKKYNEELKAEVGRLAGMDALKAEIWGLDPTTITK